MARNNNKLTRRKKKIEPAPYSIFFTFSVPDGHEGADNTLTAYIDISQCASLINRRFYRQGLNWPVSGITAWSSFSSTNSTPAERKGRIVTSILPQTWVMSNAWEKSFRSWQKMNRDALQEAESVKPKFLDFKIYMDEDHHVAGFPANALPIDYNAADYVPGEWEPSKFVIPVTGTAGTVAGVEAIAVGPSYPGLGASGKNAVSLIEGYAASRGLPNIKDPNVPSDADDADGVNPENWMSALFNDGTVQDAVVLDDMITENNQAPYPFENDGTHTDTMYPGGANQAPTLQLQDFAFITPTTVGGTTHLGGFTAPCGLVKLHFINDSDRINPAQTSNLLITVRLDLVPGDHRGYLCEPMTEM